MGILTSSMFLYVYSRLQKDMVSLLCKLQGFKYRQVVSLRPRLSEVALKIANMNALLKN